MNKEVATKVLGWHERTPATEHPRSGKRWYRPDAPHPVVLPNFSGDIAAAWLVVERLRELGYPTITITASTSHNGYIATIWRSETDPLYSTGQYVVSCFDSDLTAPLAICLAALAAVGWEE